MPDLSSLFSDVKFRFRALFRRQSMDRELGDELQFHLEQHAAALVAAGMPRAEAERRARAALGGAESVKDACRDARGIATLDSIVHDITYGLRQIRRAPAFSLVVVLSLALGIGANTAIFTLIDAVLLRWLPVRGAQELYFLNPTQAGGSTRGLEYQEFVRIRSAQTTFADIAAYGTTRVNVSVDGSLEPAAEGMLVSGNLLPMLGVSAIAGRMIGPSDDERPGGHPVAVLGHGYWTQRFGADASVVGRTIRLSGTPFTVIGVAPRSFFGLEVGRAPDIVVPMTMQPTVMPAAENWLVESILRSFWLTAVGRVPSTVNPQHAQAELARLDVLSELWTKPSRPGDRPTRIAERLELVQAASGVSNLRDQFAQPLLILMAVVGLVLLVACANVANLSLARSASRLPEFSMRLAIGAGRWRLMRQLLIENIMLAAIGGACGIVLAKWATEFLVTLMSSGRGPIVLNLSADARVLTFTVIVSLMTGVICGILPALRAAKVDVIAGVRGYARGTMGTRHARLPGKLLVVSQVSLCLVLVFGASLFLRTLQLLDRQETGHREEILLVRVEPRGSDQRSTPGVTDRLDRAYRELLQRVESIAGVTAASLAHYAPTTRVSYGGPLRFPDGTQTIVPQMMVYPNYFATMGLPLRAGRDFSTEDLAPGAPLVGVVNEAFVRAIMRGRNPIGQRIVVERSGNEAREIIGIVKDTRYANLRNETTPLLYQPFRQTPTGRGQMTLHVRAAPGSVGVAARVREEVQRMDPNMPVPAILPLSAHLDSLLSRERMVATLSTVFGVLAMLLASIGLYGLMTFSVERRTNELGLRLALGADRLTVLRMILREALGLVGVGVALGIAAASIGGRWLASQVNRLLYGVTASDPALLIVAAVTLMLVGAAAAYFPAARAARVDPMVALRNE